MRDPYLERNNPTPILKVVLLLPWDLPTTTLGTILSANKLVSFPGNESANQPWENDIVLVIQPGNLVVYARTTPLEASGR